MRYVIAFALSLALGACGSRTALKDHAFSLSDAGSVDAPLPFDVPSRPDVPPPPDVPLRPDVPVRPDVPTAPDVPPIERVTVQCPPSQRAVETQSRTLTGVARSATGRPLTVRWEVERAPVMVPTTPSSSVVLAPLAEGEYRMRFVATNDLGQSDACTSVLVVDPAINLLCPNDQSRYVSEVASLVGRAESRLGRGLSFTWQVVSRPAMSAGNVAPPTGLTPQTRLTLDQVGDWRVQLTARDAEGLTRSCVTRVRVDPDVLAICPDDQRSSPFAAISLAGRGQSRLGRPLTYGWSIESAPPTSTASLRGANQATAGFTFDVAGDWVYRLTVRNDRGNEASCTTRALAASTEAIRVELVWNIDRSCRSCNAQGGGIDIDLHLADLSRSMGRWASFAPANATCYYANCRCTAGVGTLCPSGAIEWEPAGAQNNPQLDIDHIGDLPGPENINVLQAEPGSRFAVGVHYFSGSEPTPAVVRVYCGGTLVFESEPVRLAGNAGAGGNPLWRVGDIEVGGDGRACVFRRCGMPGAVTECIRPQGSW